MKNNKRRLLVTAMIATTTMTIFPFKAYAAGKSSFNLESAIRENTTLARKFLPTVSKDSVVMNCNEQVLNHLKHLENMLLDSELEIEYSDVACNTTMPRAMEGEAVEVIERFKRDVLGCLLVDAYSDAADALMYARVTYLETIEQLKEIEE